jgi:hypothetical protein
MKGKVWEVREDIELACLLPKESGYHCQCPKKTPVFTNQEAPLSLCVQRFFRVPLKRHD